MAEDFEKLMSEKMEGASLKEVMPEFDKEAVWNELDNRLAAPAGRKVLPLWWTHAAAVAAGILLGVVLIRSLYGDGGSGVEENTVTTVIKQDAAPAVVVKRDTVFIPVQPAMVPVKEVIVRKKQAMPHEQLPVQEHVAVETSKEPTQPPATEKAIEQQPVATVKPKKIKAVHLLDIDNENRQTALYHNDADAYHRSVFVLQISAQRLPGNNPQQRKGTLIKELLK